MTATVNPTASPSAGTPPELAAHPDLAAHVSASHLQALRRTEQNNVRLVDVRTAGEYRTCHIPSALNVPLDQVSRYRDQLTASPTPLVLVCQVGGRAEQAQRLLTSAGATAVHVLEGGMVGWQQAGGEVEQGEARWALERQVRLVAGSLVLSGVLGSVAVPKAKWLSAGIGAGLTFAALSNTCMMGNMLAKLPYNRGSRHEVESAVRELAS